MPKETKKEIKEIIAEIQNKLKNTFVDTNTDINNKTVVKGKLLLIKNSLIKVVGEIEELQQYISSNSKVLSEKDLNDLKYIDKANELFDVFLPHMLVYSLSKN